MSERPIILLVEDNADDATDFKEDLEALVDVQVATICPPPTDLLDLVSLVREYDARAVILDEVLQTSSDATYMGVDALRYLHEAFPALPVIILTDFPHNPELRGHALFAENLWRKRDFGDQDEYHEEAEGAVRRLYAQMIRYGNRQDELQKPLTPADTVTEDFVQRLAGLHFQIEQSIEQIVWVTIGDEKEIRLIEVNRTAPSTGSVEVFRFAPSKDVPFPMLVADLTPNEWDKVQSGAIPLPEGWDLKSIRVFERPQHLWEGEQSVG
jgi:CheY-like chemotaxis protein